MNATFAQYEYDIEKSFTNLLFGFPSIKIPEQSEATFWLLNGRYFGGEKMLHGKFEKKSFENLDGLASDLGPILISHGVSNRFNPPNGSMGRHGGVRK